MIKDYSEKNKLVKKRIIPVRSIQQKSGEKDGKVNVNDYYSTAKNNTGQNPV